MIPTLEYEYNGRELKYRYSNVVEDFDMPVRVLVDGKASWIFPKKGGAWNTTKLAGNELEIDSNFYIESKKL